MQPQTATGPVGPVSGKAGPGKSQDNPRSRLSVVGDFIGAQGLLVVVVLFGVLLTFLSPVFLTTVNLVNLLYQCTILGVFGVAGLAFGVALSAVPLGLIWGSQGARS